MNNYPFKVEERKICIFCDHFIKEFRSWQSHTENDFIRNFYIIGSNSQYNQCPVCGSTGSERHLFLYLKHLGELDKFENKLILYITPEINLLKKIYKPSIKFVFGDLNPEKYLHLKLTPFYKIDLTQIPFDNDTFDYVIANHILEHILDYKIALQEIYRILKANGTAILQTTFSPVIYSNFEDSLIDTPELREKYYGYDDHLRIFGLQLFDDIEQTGFKLETYNHFEILSEYNPSIYGLNFKENLILARK